MWIAQKKQKKQVTDRKSILNHNKQNSETEPYLSRQEDLFEEDLRERHLETDLVEQNETVEKKLSTLDKIDRLSRLKKAIVWSEILDKPVSERYNDF